MRSCGRLRITTELVGTRKGRQTSREAQSRDSLGNGVLYERQVQPNAQEEAGPTMGERDAFERSVASFRDAMHDDFRWPATSALIDEVCGLTGHDRIGREGVWTTSRCSRRGLLPRAALRRPGARLPRALLPHRRMRFALPAAARRSLVHVEDLCTAEELKTSPTHKEMLARTSGQESLNAARRAPGSSITWGPRRQAIAPGSGTEVGCWAPVRRPTKAGSPDGGDALSASNGSVSGSMLLRRSRAAGRSSCASSPARPPARLRRAPRRRADLARFRLSRFTARLLEPAAQVAAAPPGPR